MKINKKIFFILIGLIIFFAALFFYIFHKNTYIKKADVLKVGVLFSKTGPMAKSELPVINATLLAIDEINAEGGINNKKIVPIVYDGESYSKKYAQLAKKLILQDKVDVIFGCWTSASRKEAKPIIEKYDNLLIYPNQYEGVEESKNIIYLGPMPNQQILPAISWAFSYIGKRVFLVGSEDIFSYVANEIIKHEVKSRGGEVLGEKYILSEKEDVDLVIQDIIAQKPDVIFNTINDVRAITFFDRLYELTKGVSRPPIISFGLTPATVEKIGAKKMVGDYTTLSYLKTQQLPANKVFLAHYQKKYNSNEEINDPAATAYASVYLWKQAVEQEPSASPDLVYERMLRQSVASPAGVIYIDPKNASAWRITMIGQFNKDGRTEVIWTSVNPVEPILYPNFKKKAEWDFFEYQLYSKWKKAWEQLNKGSKN